MQKKSFFVQVLIEVSTVPGRDDKAKFSAPGMDDLMVNLPNTKDGSILVNVEVCMTIFS